MQLKQDFKPMLVLMSFTVILFLAFTFLFTTNRYFDFSPYQYYYASIAGNFFIIPFVYTYYVLWVQYKKGEQVNGDFIQTLRSCLFIFVFASFFSMLFIWIYLNFWDAQAAEIFMEQKRQVQIQSLENLQDPIEKKEKLAYFNSKEVLAEKYFSAKNIWVMFYPFIVLFYLMISLVLSMFFRKK
ncbi:MAG: hypothetical protein C4K58_08330 [Flavobacteriaceae bacterium]|nr:MAG: hypothetical protein C4K58_08330 [Flavobacteriaceae bacterium]